MTLYEGNPRSRKHEKKMHEGMMRSVFGSKPKPEQLPKIAKVIDREKRSKLSKSARRMLDIELAIAAKRGNHEGIDSAVSRGGDIDSREDIEYNTPLILAVLHRKHETAEKLINMGANVNGRDCYPYTALDHAKHHHDKRMIKLLEDHGAIRSTV